MAPAMSFWVSLALLFGALKQSEACEYLTNLPNSSKCIVNVEWAKNTGIKTKPIEYKDFSFLNENSSLDDFQYVLSVKNEVDVGVSEGSCKTPCEMSAAARQFEEKRQAKIRVSGESIATTSPWSAGIKWWGWVLIVMGVCCCLPLLGLACSGFICYESVSWLIGGGEKKSKRNVKTSKAAAAPAPTVSPSALVQAVPTTFVPISSFSYAAPAQSMLVAPPVYVSSPSYATSSYAQAHMTAHAAYAAQPVTFATVEPSAFYAASAPS